MSTLREVENLVGRDIDDVVAWAYDLKTLEEIKRALSLLLHIVGDDSKPVIERMRAVDAIRALPPHDRRPASESRWSARMVSDARNGLTPVRDPPPLRDACLDALRAVEYHDALRAVEYHGGAPGARYGQEGAAAPSWAQGQQRIGDYVLLSELGRGMGVVYRAYHVRLHQHYALKLLRSEEGGGEFTPRQIVRFMREASTAARLHHPNIVAVHQVGQHEGHLYLVMDLVQGPSLAEKLPVAHPRPAESLAILEKCAHAIGTAHQAGIVHRDLKPQNILLAGGTEPMLVNFGLARDTSPSERLTMTGALLGTPAYMAPEQIETPEESGPAADVWSLGVTLYEMLVGVLPFHGDGVVQLFINISRRDPKYPRRLNGLIPPDIEAICLKCLEKDPRKRYPDGMALAEDCRRCREGHSVVARRAGLTYRTRKWVWRWRRVLTLAAVFVAALASALAWPALREAALAVPGCKAAPRK